MTIVLGNKDIDPWKEAPSDDNRGVGKGTQKNLTSHHRRTRKKKQSLDDNDDKLLSKAQSEHKRNSYKRKGDYSFRLGDYSKAISKYSRALDLDPNNHVLLSNRSAAHLAHGHAEKAVEDARACVIANPTDCRGHSRLAVALQRLELWEQAIESYRRVLEIDPENQVAQRGIEVCEVEMNLQELEKEKVNRRLEQLQEDGGDKVDDKPLFQRRTHEHHGFVAQSSSADTHERHGFLQQSSSLESEDFLDRAKRDIFRQTCSTQTEELSSSCHLRNHFEYHKQHSTSTLTNENSGLPQQGDLAGNPSGMSELSKQLRVLQSTIQSQEDQIERLGRQLRIMSDLKGVSVPELESSLKEACQDEAHAELMNQVTSLRTQLSAMTLLGSSASQGSLFGSNNFERETYERTIAGLELRVGELEEVEDALRTEISNLYRSLNDETAKASQLSSTCEQQKAQLVQLMKNVTLVKKAGSSQWSVVSKNNSTKTLQTVATDSEESVGTDNTGESSSVSEKLRNAELQLKMERDRAKLLEIQVEAREMESQLQKKQFKSRIQFQEERIIDLEHQLSSMMQSNEATTANMHASEHSRNYSIISTTPHVDEEQVEEEYEEDHQLMADAVKSSNRSSTLANIENSLDALDSQKISSGYLLKRDGGSLIKGWKKRYFCLYRSLGTYQLTYSDGPSHKVKGTIGSITTGLSTVSQTTEFPKHPFAFVLHVNPHDQDATVLYAATANQEELRKWLMALRSAVGGPNDKDKAHKKDQEKTDPDMMKRMKRLECLLQKYACH